jgi:hypothetical protein
MTKKQQLLRLRDAFRNAHDNKPATAREMADWAVENGLYKLPIYATERKCAEELADALRQEYMTVSGGRRVRTMHAWTDQQRQLWDHIDTISRPNMKMALALKRNGIVGEVKQIKTDMDYYNERHADEPPLQFSFDFHRDLEDAGLTNPPPSNEHSRQVAPTPGAPPRRVLRLVPSRASSHPASSS